MASANRAAYLMTKLTTKGLQPGLIFGGKPTLDRMDVAASCARLGSLPFHLIMAKYCDDVESALKAVGEVQEEMCRSRSEWAEMDPFRRASVACALVDEFVSARKCRRCKGTGEVLEGSRWIDCKSCQGTGFKVISANARAQACGIPESTFRHHKLNALFHDMIRYMNEIEITSLESIARKAS